MAKDLTALYNPIRKFIILNGDWVYKTTDTELLNVVFHEMRHHYQNLQIDLYLNGLITNVDVQVIEEWKICFEKYYKPSQTDFYFYINQSIEKDAFEFSKSLLTEIIT